MKKYVIRDAATWELFTSADISGAYFDKEDIRLFDSEQEALNRLQEEAALFPSQFSCKIFEIVPVFAF